MYFQNFAVSQFLTWYLDIWEILIWGTTCYVFSTSVRLGEHDIESNPDCTENVGDQKECALPVVNVAIEELIPHEEYNPDDRNQYHDIALLRLKQDVEYTGKY